MANVTIFALISKLSKKTIKQVTIDVKEFSASDCQKSLDTRVWLYSKVLNELNIGKEDVDHHLSTVAIHSVYMNHDQTVIEFLHMPTGI